MTLRTPPGGCRRRRRTAAAAVEFALIAPLMILFTFGLIEIGRLMLVKESATQATRAGARLAIRPNAEVADVVQRVKEELALMSVDRATIAVDPSSLSLATPGTYVTVQVSIPTESVSWIPGFFDFHSPHIVAQSVMRRETTH